MASTREREGRHTGLYRDIGGRQRSAGTYRTKREALKAAKLAEARGYTDRAEAAYPVARRGNLTVAGYGAEWLPGHRLEPTSRESYAAMLKHVNLGLGTKVLRDLSPADVRGFFRGLEASGMTGGTVGHVMTVLRAMCQTAVQDGLLERDPTQGIKIAGRRAREMRIVEPSEYARLLDATPERYRLVVRTLVETGLRWGELMGLKASDIKDGQLTVRRVLIQVNGRTSVRDYGKTSRSHRTIQIPADLERELVESGQRNTPDGFVIRAARGGALTRSNFRRVWLIALKSAGLSGIRVHDLRHSHASWLLAHGADLVSVRDRLGHSDIRTTSRYLHTLKKDTDPCLTALSVALRAA